MDNRQSEIIRLINLLQDAFREQDLLLFDEEYEHFLGTPCSEERIVELETHLQTQLPPSYRMFLQQHDGWTHFTGDAAILGCTDFYSDWFHRRIAELSELFFENGPDPLQRGCFPIVLGLDARTFLLVDPMTAQNTGEMNLILYELTHQTRIFSDFIEFLSYKLTIVQTIIKTEQSGTDDD